MNVTFGQRITLNVRDGLPIDLDSSQIALKYTRNRGYNGTEIITNFGRTFFVDGKDPKDVAKELNIPPSKHSIECDTYGFTYPQR